MEPTALRPRESCCRSRGSFRTLGGCQIVTSVNRTLTEQERELAEWMLRHGTAEAVGYLDQLIRAQVTPWKCQCGCASINFQIEGNPPIAARRQSVSRTIAGWPFSIPQGDPPCLKT